MQDSRCERRGLSLHLVDWLLPGAALVRARFGECTEVRSDYLRDGSTRTRETECAIGDSLQAYGGGVTNGKSLSSCARLRLPREVELYGFEQKRLQVVSDWHRLETVVAAWYREKVML